MVAWKRYMFIVTLAVFSTVGFAQPPQQGGPPSSSFRLKHLKKALKLTDDQVTKVKEILQATDTKMKELQSKEEKDHEQEMTEIEKIMASQDEQIAKLLDDTQKQKFDKLKEDSDPEGKGMPMGGPDGNGGAPPPPPDDGGGFEPPF